MAIKKSDLYSSLWASCDELRGGMDASQNQDYVLFMLFITTSRPHVQQARVGRRRPCASSQIGGVTGSLHPPAREAPTGS